MRKEKQEDKRRFYLNEWADADGRLGEVKEAVIALAETGRNFPWTIALLLEHLQSLTLQREEALENLADYDIETETEALRAFASMKGGEKK